MRNTVCIAPSAVAAVLRREFFARAGGVAARYGIDPDDLLRFCEGQGACAGAPTPGADAPRPTGSLDGPAQHAEHALHALRGPRVPSTAPVTPGTPRPPRLARPPSVLRWGSSPLHVTRLIAHLDDLVHVVACVRGSANAWHDLRESYEPALIHATSDRLDGVGAMIGVRRWFAALRMTTAGGATNVTVHVPGLRNEVVVPTLRDYRGYRPLRHWLAERMLGELSRQPATAAGRRLRLTSSGVGAILRASQQ